MPDRDLDITKFSYLSYRKFKKALGEFDAVVECNELAILEFLDNYKENENSCILGLSRKHKIKVDAVEITKFSSRIRSFYIVSVLQQFEQFLKDFRKEYLTYFDKVWTEKSKGQTHLENLLYNIDVCISEDTLNIYNYYRLIRNYFSHTDRDIEQINELFSKVNQISLASLDDIILSTKLKIHSLDEVNFEDFLIITNIVKHIAYVISTFSKPTNEHIASILLSELEDRKLKNIKKNIHNSPRLENSLKNLVFTKFGRFSEQDLIEVVEALKDLLVK